jgi:hypothetical protein
MVASDPLNRGAIDVVGDPRAGTEGARDPRGWGFHEDGRCVRMEGERRSAAAGCGAAADDGRRAAGGMRGRVWPQVGAGRQNVHRGIVWMPTILT